MARKIIPSLANRGAGGRIRRLRECFGMTRPAFAKRLGITPESLASKETGRAPFRDEELERIQVAMTEHLKAAEKAFKETFGSSPATDTQ